jgi:hypothetical protein
MDGKRKAITRELERPFPGSHVQYQARDDRQAFRFDYGGHMHWLYFSNVCVEGRSAGDLLAQVRHAGTGEAIAQSARSKRLYFSSAGVQEMWDDFPPRPT